MTNREVLKDYVRMIINAEGSVRSLDAEKDRTEWDKGFATGIASVTVLFRHVTEGFADSEGIDIEELIYEVEQEQ